MKEDFLERFERFNNLYRHGRVELLNECLILVNKFTLKKCIFNSKKVIDYLDKRKMQEIFTRQKSNPCLFEIFQLAGSSCGIYNVCAAFLYLDEQYEEADYFRFKASNSAVKVSQDLTEHLEKQEKKNLGFRNN